MSNKWFFTFDYDKFGYGDLTLHEGNLTTVFSYPLTRTGFINKEGKLANAIWAGLWDIREPSVITTEEGMVVDPHSEARKIRLHDPDGMWTRFLIHGDGGKPGSLGCIVTNRRFGNNPGLFKYCDSILEKQPVIPVYINTTVPEEVYNGVV